MSHHTLHPQESLPLEFTSRRRAHIDAVVNSLRAAARKLHDRLDIYSEIQLNARAAPARERKNCQSP
jgi:hypothetical protein